MFTYTFIGDEMKNDLRISYPRSKYPILSKEIEKYIKTNIDAFIQESTSTIQNLPYSLYIYYDEYETQEYISYVFYNSLFTGGAHPNNTIYTINYDKTKNKIVTIHDLVEKNPNLLHLFSRESRRVLQNKKEFQDLNVSQMLIEGTIPNENNFRNFVFTPNGILLLFEQYQVAPYYMGVFQVYIK